MQSSIPNFRILALSLVLASLVSAQSQSTVYFSTRFTETPASGRGGFIVDSSAPCFPIPIFGLGYVIESAVSNSPGLCFVTPGAINTTVVNSLPPGITTTDFFEVANSPQFQLITGDVDGDGLYHECSSFPGVDAMHILAPAVGRPNNVHEMFISTFRSTSANCGNATGTGGYTGTGVEPADMVLFQKAANVYPAPSNPRAPVFLIRRAHFEILLGLPGPMPTMDVNAFARDEVTGDLYVSFDTNIANASVVVSQGAAPTTITILPGDIIRIPGTAYTPSGPYGIVTAPIAGQAERIYNSINVNSMVLTAGGSITSSGVLNVYGISLDPINTSLMVTAAGFVLPGLLFTVDNRGGTVPGLQNQTATAIYSNQGAGAFATLNGVTMNNPLAAGLNNLSFSNGFYAGPLDALSVVVHAPSLDPMADRPVHLDAFPFDRAISDPLYNGILTCYVSGLPPGSLAGVFARLDVATPGGFISRFNVEGALGGYPDLYVDPFGFANQNCVIAPSILFPTSCQIPGAQAIFNGGTNPVLVWTDPNNGAVNGDTCFQIDLSSYLMPGVIAPVPTPMITLQVLDFTNLRLSSPLSFQLN